MNITNGERGNTALFTSTKGAVTGCTSLNDPTDPQKSSANAASGDAGVMMVDGEPVKIQSGGVGYSANLTPILASKSGHIIGHNKYIGDNMRSELNQHKSLPVMSAGSKKKFKKRNTRKLRKTAKKFTYRNMKKVKSLAKKAKKLANKKATSKKYKFSKKNRSNKFKRMVANKGKRAPFFAYGGKKTYKKMKGGCGGYNGGTINNVPLGSGQSVGGVHISNSALANPPPQTSYLNCGK